MADQVSKTRIVAPSLQAGRSEWKTARVSLTAAQILTLNTAPVSLVAAPGTGKLLIFEELVFNFTNGGTQFASGGAVEPVYHGATSSLSVGAIPASTINAAAASLTHLAQQASTTGITCTANVGIDLYAASANFTTGTGTAVVTVSYEIFTIG